MSLKMPKFPKIRGIRQISATASKTGGVNLKNVRFVNPARSIGMKLFLFFFIAIVASILLVGLISYNKSKSIIESQMADAKGQTVVQVTQKITMLLMNFEGISTRILLIPELSEFVNATKLSDEMTVEKIDLRKKVDGVLQQYVFSDASIAGIYLIPVDEKLPGLGTGSISFEQASSTDWYKKAVEADGKIVWVSTVPESISGSVSSPTFGMVRLIKDKNTLKPNYVLLVELKELILRAAGAGAMGEGGATYAIDKEGIIISSPNAEELGTKFPLSIKSGSSGQGSTVGNLNGEKTLVAYSTLPSSGWMLAGSVPYDKIVAGTTEIFSLSVIMAVVGAILAVAIGWLVVIMIARPLQKMSGVMREAENGDLSVTSPFTNRKDEIGRLAVSFNEMIGKIRTLVEQTNRSAEKVLQTASELSDSSRKTAQSAREIATATEQIAAGAGNLAVEAEKGADLTIQMSDRMKEAVTANVQMASAAAEVRDSSGKGSLHMQALSEKTNATEELTRSMVKKVEDLKESTSSIRKILDALNNMARQTNILALNATIEAARAGAAGRGFMVVADEIRKLADQTKQNIDNVGEMTERIRKEIDETVLLVSEAYPMFREQIASVKETNEIFDSVNERMNLFVQQLDAVTDSISHLDQTQKSLTVAMTNVSAVAEESSATSEEVAGLSSEQLGVSESLVELANRLEEVSKGLTDSLTKFRM
ncbi:methyl-accepting chemotaxis protein [Paenibacillus thermotolerans]|uniref:methyl-accepting chemotaxis protein n=1 Tax=Paenibacillus thermotolerans TaxID=3027807 RepID=UPI0023683ACB|nr:MULTISPECIES: methyl-accepting chemotaxis protein [unclassified Paenibacillus]